MDSILFAAMASFILGASGYVIFRYWIIPIFRYRKIKQLIFIDLNYLKKNMDAGAFTGSRKKSDKLRMKSLRKNCTDLASHFNGDIPYWYRLMLESRKESPIDVSEPSLKLSRAADITHARKQIDLISKYLRLT